MAAATSIVLVAIANLSASTTHFIHFMIDDGFWGVPWNLIVWGVPGMAAGALLGSHLQGRFSEGATQRFFAGLFVFISLSFLVFTILFS